jgi:transposase-like protein
MGSYKEMSDFSQVERAQIDNQRRMIKPIKSIEDVQELIPQDPDPDPYGYAQEIEESFGLDLLTTSWKAAPDDKQWVRRLKARARKSAVARLFMSGYQVSDISAELGVADITVYKDIQAIGEEWRQSYLTNTESIAARNIARLESYLKNLAAAVNRGDVKAITAAVEVIKEINSILGVRQGVQVNIETYIREIAESNGFDPDVAVQMAEKISINIKM